MNIPLRLVCAHFTSLALLHKENKPFQMHMESIGALEQQRMEAALTATRGA